MRRLQMRKIHTIFYLFIYLNIGQPTMQWQILIEFKYMRIVEVHEPVWFVWRAVPEKKTKNI